MGGMRNRRKQKQKKLDDQRKLENRPDDRDAKPMIGYKNIVKENEVYEKYYKLQKIVPDSDWSKFMECLRRPLPASFRITNYFGGQAQALRQIVEGDQFKTLVNKDGIGTKNDSNGVVRKVDQHSEGDLSLNCLPWYPNRFGWQMTMSRIEIRRSESALRLHNFLISESESGYISRQEAVSMIPPLVLDVQPHHKVLDMCAAPGSKTAQIIEMLHTNSNSFSTGSGVVVANDVDNKRCYMLVHQAKRMHSPCAVITNHDAGNMPKFYQTVDGVRKELKFDRVLCDAPCTGDGTLRKNCDVWTKWNPANGNNFHGLQSRIARRGVELLAKDGLLVYSTCSLNPMEDESVVSSLLVAANGGLELVDVADRLPGLKYAKGLEHWTVVNKDLAVFENYELVPEVLRTQIRESMFPPANAGDLNLNRCVRVLPHLQDTGGFFVAVLKKTVDRLPWESKATEVSTGQEQQDGVLETEVKEPAAKKARRFPPGSFKEDPFLFFKDDEAEWPAIKNFYQINDEFPYTQLMYRSESGRKRNLYYLTEMAKNIIASNEGTVKFINAGARIFARNVEKDAECGFRLSQEGLPSVYPFVDPAKVIELNIEDVELVLGTDAVSFDQFSERSRPGIEKLGPGSCILLFKKVLKGTEEVADVEGQEVTVPICCWKGKTTVRPYIAKNERIHFLRVCGINTDDIGKLLFFL